MTTPLRNHKQVRAWFASKSWRTRFVMSGRFTMGGACCSNPNPQPYDPGNGTDPFIKCMNCGA